MTSRAWYSIILINNCDQFQTYCKEDHFFNTNLSTLRLFIRLILNPLLNVTVKYVGPKHSPCYKDSQTIHCTKMLFYYTLLCIPTCILTSYHKRYEIPTLSAGAFNSIIYYSSSDSRGLSGLEKDKRQE